MMGKLFVRTTVGVAIGCILGTASEGPDFLGGIALAIACTGGLALLPCLPIAYVIGLVVTIWWIPFGRGAWTREVKIDETDHQANEPRLGESIVGPDIESLPRAKRAVVDFVGRALATGRLPANIERQLRVEGWNDAVIQLALAAHGVIPTTASDDGTPHPPSPRPDPR